jgi:two-component system, LytTR family, response regulator
MNMPLLAQPSPLRFVVIDDESPARENIRLLLRHVRPDLVCVGEAASVSAGVALLLEVETDLVFLDVQLGDGTGFDLLERIPDRRFAVIFVTAFEAHSIRAFRFAALDYLLKPIDPQILSDALLRLPNAAPSDLKLKTAQNNLAQQRLSRLLLPTQEGFMVIQTADIIRCEADANYTRFFIQGQKPILASNSLAHFEDLLADNHFTRVHHKHLVNLAYVQRYHRGRGGYLELRDGSQVEVSVRKREDFLEAMQRFALSE